jgi:hypothetical protein
MRAYHSIHKSGRLQVASHQQLGERHPVALVLVARKASYPQALMQPYRKGER